MSQWEPPPPVPIGQGLVRQHSCYFPPIEPEPPVRVVVDPPPVEAPGTLREQAVAALAEALERLTYAKTLLALGDDPADGSNRLHVPVGVCHHCGVRKRAINYNIPGTSWTSWYTPRWCSCESTSEDESSDDRVDPGVPYAYLRVKDFDVL